MTVLRPNVIVYIMDSLRADRLGCYGYSKSTTPNIDQFAKDAVLFEQAYAQSTWTYPSGASILSGMYASSLGVRSIHDPLPINIPWLPEAFRNHGYTTACFSGNALISEPFGFKRGFDILVDQFSDPDLPRYRLPVVVQSQHKKALQRYVDVSDLVVVTSDDLHRAFMSFAEDCSNVPFLSVIWSMDTHHPYFDRAHLVSGSPDPIYYQQDIAQLRDPAKESELSDLYDRMVYYNDRTFGDLLRLLNRLDLYDEAVIIAVADHGEAFGEHGIMMHSGPPYRVLTSVPLMIKLPRLMLAGTRRTEITQLIDLLPTLQTYVRFENALGEQPQGTSLLNSGRSRPLTAWSEGGGHLSLRTKRWCYMRPQYVHTVRRYPGRLAKVVRDLTDGELFNLVHDPGETRDVRRRLQHLLSYLSLARQARTMWRMNHRLRRNMVFGSADVKPNGLVEDRLRALGYID